MANLQYRTASSIGKPSYTPSVEKEATTYTMCIVTEGDVEELSYIKGYFKTFLSNSNIIPQYVNDSLDNKEKHASHPKRRLAALKRYRASVHPNWKEYPDDITWLVCDRDAQSFKESQYDDVLVDCKKERIELIISNPSFQLWLLMLTFETDLCLKSEWTKTTVFCLSQLLLTASRNAIESVLLLSVSCITRFGILFFVRPSI